MLDVMIIGGGPAGLTAALYAARAGLTVRVYEKLMVGGQAAMTSQIENYPGFAQGIGGPELSMAMEEQAGRAGADIVYDAVRQIDCAGKRILTDAGWQSAAQLILAMGAQARKLGVPGEERLTGSGVSYCATCDGVLYRGRRVAVIGGGNSAAEEALYLSGIGCDVLLVHRRDALRAEEALAARVLRDPRVTPVWNSQVEAFDGETKLTALRLSGDRTEPIDGAFVSIGRLPDTSLVKGQIALDAEGFILADEDCRTAIEGVFAIGDVRTKPLRQVVTAVADGATAASWCRKAE